MALKTSLILLCVYIPVVVYAQDCKVGGKQCADHEQCCGGCCFDGECIDTYQSCQSASGVCDDHVCRDEENCVVYIPECSGCEPVPVCKIIGN